MTHKAHSSYLQTEVLSSDPLNLVRLLYRAAIDALATARRHLQSGGIRERSCAIAKASDILRELTVSLDHQRGGEISQALAALYAYMRHRLNEANAQQREEPLVEVQKLLMTLLEAWVAIGTGNAPVIGTDFEPQRAHSPGAPQAVA